MTEIFVFGSNLAGRHGRGAARHARLHHGAKFGVGYGRTGNSYAIPTKDMHIQTLPVHAIKYWVDEFIGYAMANPGLTFKVTAIGTGLAGHTHEEIAPLFADAPRNCRLPDEWADIYLRNAVS